MNRMKAVAVMVSLAAGSAMAQDPTFTCKEAVSLASSVYDRVALAHSMKRVAQAKTAAESFWDVATTFNRCGRIDALGAAMTQLGYAKGVKAEYSPSPSMSYSVAGKSGTINWQEVNVSIPKDAEITVINAKAVPSTLSVEGIRYQAVTKSAGKGGS